MKFWSLCALFIFSLLLIGCDDPLVGPMMEPVMDEMIAGEQKPVTDNAMDAVVAGEVEEHQEPELLPLSKWITPRVPTRRVEITYYGDHTLTKVIKSAVVGTTIYAKVVMSNDVPIIFSNDYTATPGIASNLGGKTFQYRMKPRSVGLRDLQNGDARPYKKTNHIFICKYIPQAEDVGVAYFVFINNGFLTTPARVNILSSVVCELPTQGRTAFVHEPVPQNPSDFVGQVLTLVPKNVDLYYDAPLPVRSYGTPLPGVVVTIVSGPRSGEQAVTDAAGRYVFRGIREDKLRLRVEKQCLSRSG